MRSLKIAVAVVVAIVVGVAVYAELVKDRSVPPSYFQSIASNLETVWSLAFAPDGRLFLTERPGRIRVIDHDQILRMNTDGSVPSDNPFPKSYIWSYGHRNPQGLAFHPQSGRLVDTEQGTGPPGHGNNEVNVIEPGKNYGWPRAVGEESHTGFAVPLAVFNDPTAGATFVTSDRYPSLRGNLLIGTLGSQRLLSVVFKEGDTIEWLRTDILIDKTFGRIRDVIEGSDGFLYFSTSNRDGRVQKIRAGDDHVFRLLSEPK